MCGIFSFVHEIFYKSFLWLVKAMVFPVAMYGYESWTIKKADHWEIDAFELCCWRRLLRVPWTARRSNQSILKEINPECSLEGLMLKLQYFGHLIWRVDSGEVGSRGWDGWMASPTSNGHEFEQTPGDHEGQGSFVCCSPWGHKESDTTEQLNNKCARHSTMCWILWWFILSVNLARPHYPDIWSNTSLDVSMKVFFSWE